MYLFACINFMTDHAILNLVSADRKCREIINLETPPVKSPYLKKKDIPKDPWGNDYHYRAPGQNGDYDLYSLGRDDADGGEGEDADVVSW